MQKITDIMTRNVLRITPEQSVALAASLMLERDAGSVAVEEDGKLVGMLTIRDIADQAFILSVDTPIRDIMTDAVECCRDDDDFEVVARHMAELGVRRLPVVDRQHRMLGIVTLGSIVGIRAVGQAPAAAP